MNKIESPSSLPSPHTSGDTLTLDSTIANLKLNACQLDIANLGKDLLETFNRDARLPGVIIVSGNDFFGLISREAFLELMSLPYRMDLFAHRPIVQLYEYVSHDVLKLDGNTSIFEAAKRCLQRPAESVYEPIVVDLGQSRYRILDVRKLLIAQSQLYELTSILLKQREAEILNLNQRLEAENTRLEAEVEITHRLQQMLLPNQSELEEIPTLEIAGFMQPANEVGGDYYDVLQYQDRVKIGIGDVTGHGLESGVLMLMVQTAVRTLLTHGVTDPVEFFDTLNRTIYGNLDRMVSDKNLTLALLDYDRSGTVQLSGQHEEVLLIRQSGKIERIETIDLGFPIGLELDVTPFIAQQQLSLNPGDALILYTDGITEAENEAGELYGLERLCAVIERSWWGASAASLCHDIIEDVRAHIGTQIVYDDITLLILKQRFSY